MIQEQPELKMDTAALNLLHLQAKNDVTHGVRVDSVVADSSSASAGLQVGDYITHINGKPVFTMEKASELLLSADSASTCVVTILRKGQSIVLNLENISS